MSTAVFNRKAIQAGPGKLYLVATPASVVATTPATIIKELLENFLVSGDIRLALKAGVQQWPVMDKSGFKAKVDQKPVMSEDCENPPEVIGYSDIGYTATAIVQDLDAAKLADILSASGGQIITTAASSTQAGRTTVLGGGQRQANLYTALYRFESRQVPGEFRHILIPATTLAFDGDAEYTKDKPTARTVKFNAQPSGLLFDPITGRDVIWVEDYVTAAHS